MKVFIAFLVCIVAAFAGNPELNDYEIKSVEMLKACVHELKLDPRMLYDEGVARNLSLDAEACLKACVDKKLGLLNEDGTYNLERILSIVEKTPEMQKKAKTKYYNKIKGCVAIVGQEPCKLAACVHGMPKSVYMKNE